MSNRSRCRTWSASVKGRKLYVLPEINNDDSDAFKNGLAIRNVANKTGECPSCGCTAVIKRDRRYPNIFHGRFEHEEGCPALLENV